MVKLFTTFTLIINIINFNHSHNIQQLALPKKFTALE